MRNARVHLTGPGTCTLTASQGGNANWNAAEDVSQKFTIARPVCSVPKVVGKRLAAAKAAIAQNHCRTGRVRHASSPNVAKGRVISQSLRPGRSFVENTRVNLVVSRGR